VHVLDLAQGVDPWAGVRRKHREWVRRAEKANVDVVWADADTPDAEASAAMDRFERVYGELVERLNLSTHGPAFTRRLWELFRAGRRAQLVTATVAGEPVAAMLHVTWGDVMLWYAGGQAEAGAPMGAGKLLLWRSIQRAQELGMRRYHMWGTATDSLAHYKEGFGAREERYVGTRSAALNPVADKVVEGLWAAQRTVLGWRQTGGPVRGVRERLARRSARA
jgi:lipid II:glycine glycyltransferase (peptidoglycan interpeptide bridge formation enzyme)